MPTLSQVESCAPARPAGLSVAYMESCVSGFCSSDEGSLGEEVGMERVEVVVI